jgi:hypothetical protein
LTLDLEIHQHLGSLKHVINIIMWIRDSGCYRKIQTIKDRHKLSPILEGPFEVIEVAQPGSYKLQWEDGSEVSNSWNIDQL